MIGTVFGHYRVTQKLGQGGVGDVWKAIDLSLDREVALKLLRPELAAQHDVVARFRAEALALAKLNHPNIATIHGFHVEGACPFMVMEYVHGQTLHAVVRGFGRMSVKRAVPLFLQVLDGIQHAHEQGIVHRDLKASNVMLSQLGIIKVLDFGIARRLGSVHLTRGTHSLGTPAWMAPEQVRGAETDVHTDVYALGLLLYWLVAARLPFEGETEFAVQRAHLEQAPPSPRAFAPDLPLAIEKAIVRALAKDRAQRWASVAELRYALGEGYEPEATRPLPIVPSEPGRWRDADDELTHLTDAPVAAEAEKPAPGPTRVLQGARDPAGAAPPEAASAPAQRQDAAPAPHGDVAPSRTGGGAAQSSRPAASENPSRWLAWAAAALIAVCVLLGIQAVTPNDEADVRAARAPSADAQDPAGPAAPGMPAMTPPPLEATSELSPPAPAAVPEARGAALREQRRAAPSAARKTHSARARKDDAWVIRRD